MKKLNIVVGHKFGHLTVTDGNPARINRIIHWPCRCDCGGLKYVTSANLCSGRVSSCGCLKLIHGESRRGGMTDEYKSWAAMKARCTRKSHAGFIRYGGRGIAVCDRWMKFENFLNDMGRKPTPRHHIDRIDTNGNYDGDNCRWVTQKENNQNRRDSRWVFIGGIRYNSLREAENITGIPRKKISGNIKKGASGYYSEAKYP